MICLYGRFKLDIKGLGLEHLMRFIIEQPIIQYKQLISQRDRWILHETKQSRRVQKSVSLSDDYKARSP